MSKFLACIVLALLMPVVLGIDFSVSQSCTDCNDFSQKSGISASVGDASSPTAFEPVNVKISNQAEGTENGLSDNMRQTATFVVSAGQGNAVTITGHNNITGYGASGKYVQEINGTVTAPGSSKNLQNELLVKTDSVGGQSQASQIIWWQETVTDSGVGNVKNEVIADPEDGGEFIAPPAADPTANTYLVESVVNKATILAPGNYVDIRQETNTSYAGLAYNMDSWNQNIGYAASNESFTLLQKTNESVTLAYGFLNITSVDLANGKTTGNATTWQAAGQEIIHHGLPGEPYIEPDGKLDIFNVANIEAGGNSTLTQSAWQTLYDKA